MRTRIKQFYNIKKHVYEYWYIEIKSEVDKKYHILFNGDKPHCFETYDEAKNYLESIRKDLEELVATEPR